MTGWAMVLQALGLGLAVLLLAWTLLLYVPFRWRPVGLYLFVPKMAAGAFTPFIAAAGLLLALVGGLAGSWWLAVPAALAALGASIVVVRLGLVRTDLTAALGPDWADRIPIERRARMWANLVANATDAVDWAADQLDGPVVLLLGSSQGGVLAMAVAARSRRLALVAAHNVLDPIAAGVIDRKPSASLAHRRLPAPAGYAAAGRPPRS
jgi:hypothetical protein